MNKQSRIIMPGNGAISPAKALSRQQQAIILQQVAMQGNKLASQVHAHGQVLGQMAQAVQGLSDIPNWMAALVAVLERRLELEPGAIAEELVAELLKQREATYNELKAVEEAQDMELAKGVGARCVLGRSYPPAQQEEDDDGRGPVSS